MSAADAGVVAIVKGVVGYVVLAHVVPDLLGSPVDHGIDFDDIRFGIEFDTLGFGSRGSLVAADGGNPGAETSELTLLRLHLTDATAQIRIPSPESGAMLGFLFGRIQL